MTTIVSKTIRVQKVRIADEHSDSLRKIESTYLNKINAKTCTFFVHIQWLLLLQYTVKQIKGW